MSELVCNQLAAKPVPWLSDGHGIDEVAVSTRIRVARNLAGYPFPGRADQAVRCEILSLVQDVAPRLELMRPAVSGKMSQLSDVERSVLLERRLVSKELCGCAEGSGFVYRDNEQISIMINEEDHLRLQVLVPRLQLQEAWHTAADLDSALAALFRFSFEPEWGYLTACPSNVGTGLRASVMLHLPALVMTGRMRAVANAARKLLLGVRGILGEGSEAVGNLFQVSNQSTLGESEEDILSRLGAMIDRLVAQEQCARLRLARTERSRLCDHVARAYGVLREAYILPSREALNCLSALRLGVEMGLFRHLPVSTLNRLAIAVLPGHLQVACGRELDEPERDVARASRVRSVIRSATS